MQNFEKKRGREAGNGTEKKRKKGKKNKKHKIETQKKKKKKNGNECDGWKLSLVKLGSNE